MKTLPRFPVLFRISKYLSVLLLAIFSSFTVYAQCKINSLIVNTGYTPAGPIAAGTSDPHWDVVGLSAGVMGITPTPPATPYDAIGVSSLGASDPNSSWISFYNPSGSWYLTTPLPTQYWMTLRRTFRLCEHDSIRVSLDFARDNYISYLIVDNDTLWKDTVGLAPSNYTNWQPIPPKNYLMLAGTHTIEVKVHNFHDAANATIPNPHGFNLKGTVASVSGANTIIDDNNCPTYVCSEDECTDECYWKVTGNNILNNNNIFGTLTPHDIDIKTSNTSRGIMTQNGLLGWNTMTPNAYLHVLCTGNNPDDGGAGSDVRFENLEPGQGTILVIDPAGFVYDSRIRINPDGTMGGEKELRDRITELEAKIEQLAAVLKTQDVMTPGSDNNSLGQNTPNPFGKETTIGYNVHTMQQSAAIVIHDINGKQLASYPIKAKGKGSVTVSSEKIAPGMYMYSLVVDGREVASKRMVFDK